jgi:P-type Ca2+ transporter type 2C
VLRRLQSVGWGGIVPAMQDGALLVASDIGVEVRSALPGRFRIWVAGLYRNEDLERSLERGLNGSSSRRRVSANSVAATVLVEAPTDVSPHEVVEEIAVLVRQFAQENSISLEELERRGRKRPSHLVVNGAARDPATFFALSRSKRKVNATSNGVQGAVGEEQAVHLWHALDAGQIAELLHVQPEGGLVDEEAQARRARFGTNDLTQIARRSGLSMFLDQFKELPVALLAGSTVLSMLTGGVADGLVILGVIVINGVIGFVTENRAERTIASLTHTDAPDVDVLRQGEWRQAPLGDIVPGDVIRLSQGTFVPADARLLRAQDLTVDESALTGESVPVNKTIAPIDDSELPLADRTNMIYRGTLVTGGTGLALVIATGRATQVGQLQAMVGEVERPETPMQKQLRHLGERTMVLAGGVCGGVFLLGLLRGQPMGAMVRTAVSLAVAAVPEGLPTVAITTLALGIRKMKSHNVLVRRLDAIETLGAVQVLCFDKTGTITENRMRVVQASVSDEHLTVDICDGAARIQTKQGPLEPHERRELELLLQVGALCSDAALVHDGEGSPRIQGSSTETALVEFALQAGVDVERLREQHPIVKSEPRSDSRKLMATVHRRRQATGYLVAVKGSPMEVLDLCKTRLVAGQVVSMSEPERRVIRRQNERMAGDALRVLGLAYAEHAAEPTSCDEGLIWLGLSGLADPPRAGLPELFEKFRRAGVRSVMITGDQSATAYAIAQQIGLAEDGELRTLDSVELENMDPDLLADIAPRVQVFSRVSPRHKLRIVQALQKAGLVVAMTGDGINDCPALKAADIGVAMGGGGGTVAREVADVILETDDLHSMLTAIEHGRVIHADIKKAVRFILATNFSEIMLTLLSVAAGFGEGMTPMQLLWINLVSDIFPELALAVQPAEHDVLEQAPRDPDAKMFSKRELRQIMTEGSLLTAGAMGVYGYGVSRYGLSPAAQSVSFLALSTAQLLHAYSTRSEKNHLFDGEPPPKNPYINMAVGGGIGLTLLMQIIPGARRWFGSTVMPPIDWAVAALGAVAPLVANEMVKAARVSSERRSAQLSESPHSAPRALPAGH